VTIYERTIDVAAPPAVVFAVMADVERWHEWTASIRGVRLIGRPLAVGSGALIRQPKFPPAWWKVTDLQPDREFTWVSVAPGLRVMARHAALESPGGTRALLSLTYTGVFGDWFARLTRDITERYLVMEAEGLKGRCETSRA
jgi:hypothetical protein